MNFKRVEKRTAGHEGFRSHPYLDSQGIWTIGEGSTMIDGKPVTANTPPITEERARQEMRANLWQACIDAQNFCPEFSFLSDERQEVIVEMAFQMGYDRLCQFKKMQEALRTGNFKAAAAQMRSSLWYTQTRARAEELAQAMEKE